MKKLPFLSARERAGNRVTIGFAGIADFRSVIGQEYIAGVTKAASDYGINLINFAGAIKYSLSDDIDFIDHYLKKYRFMRPAVIDGLVTWASSLSAYLSYERIEELHAKLEPLPMVALGVPILPAVPCISTSSSDGIHLVMDHLTAKHGYARIGFLGCSGGRQYEERLESWRAELAARGLAEDPAMVGVLETLEPKDISRWMASLCGRFELRERKHIDALVTVSDVAAACVIEELAQRGIRVPRDLAVTGYNNQLQSISSACPITTVDLRYFQRGYAAVELLLDRIENPVAPHETQVVGSALIVRRSCGCFEELIEAAGSAQASPPCPEPIAGTAGSDPYAALARRARASAASLPPASRESLADALIGDIRGETAEGFLVWLQGALASERSLIASRVAFYQGLVSELRSAALEAVGRDLDLARRAEDVFHRARVLISVSSGYYEKSHQTDAYRFNNLARIAISLASALNGAEVLEALRFHLGELEIPGMMLVLQEEALPDLGGASLEFVHPPSYVPIEKIPYRIAKSAFIPRSFLPQDKHWAMMMEILYYSGQYLGYALMEMGPSNVALYDAVRALLSHSLYAAYVREGRNLRLRESLLRSERVSSILNTDEDRPQGRLGIDTRKVVDYLMDHMGEMTDLGAMAKELSISKSYLIRRTKALTGYTVQALHEMLKIEQAKILLETRNIKISEIALRLGFQNQGYFSFVFKKNTGMSPKDWVQRRD
jgi:DNA-binding LacI/PurR family transcriptional regulator/AraC-like DNA-binding protein